MIRMATTALTKTPVTALFLDIGGVMLTNGWDRRALGAAAKQFGLDLAELSDRHPMTFDTYESRNLNLDEYMCRGVFYEGRPFTDDHFLAFYFLPSWPYPYMTALVQCPRT